MRSRHLPGLIVSAMIVALVASTATFAAPHRTSAWTDARYGGIGALTQRFHVRHANASVRLSIGVGGYKVDAVRDGRVASYHVVLSGKGKLTRAALYELLRRELPADATQVQGWKKALDPGVYCAIYRTRWLGRVLYGPYAVLYAS